MNTDFDIGEITISVFITYFVMRFVTGFLETETRLTKLHKILTFSWLWMLIFCVLGQLFGFKFFNDITFNVLCFGVLYVMYQLRHFPTTRTLAIAVVPFIIVQTNNNFLKLLTPNFFKANHDFFDTINISAILWLIGFGIYANKQNKRDKLQRQKEVEERRILEAKKEQLEYQVAERTAELTQQKEELEKALLELKSTQAQLIQSEKLASLGELTAGIAHEIQNPLNFVNNFAELSVDLVKDLKEEIEKSVLDKEYLAELFSDLTQNQEKINLHGKRASSIVSGMLEHSRTSTGERVLTDINKLADEYLRLSYHGLRAKDKNFNSDFTTDFDENLPKINVIPQDIGRVLLNIINNAFYAVSGASSGTPAASLSHQSQYSPKVTVSTELSPPFRGGLGGVVVRVTDNGTGMSEATKAKIFQPFFTTKPTGQGTGLGLSLAYDIITKGHGGTIDVESIEGEGTIFLIKLPTH